MVDAEHLTQSRRRARARDGDTGGDAPRGARRVKLAEVVAKAILDLVDAEGLKAGDPLPNERGMLETFRVGRNSLREALRLLEHQGVLSVRPGPGGGPVIREATPEIFAGTATMLMQFFKVTVSEVMDARVALEPEIAAVAAQQRSGYELEELRSTSQTMLRATGDFAVFNDAFRLFHEELGYATHNGLLIMIDAAFRQIWLNVNKDISPQPRAIRATAEIHRDIFEAVQAQDPTAAREASRSYLEQTRRWLRALQPGLLRQQVKWSLID